MAEYSNNYTQNTTEHVLGTQTYKFSRTVSQINQNAIDTSCIFSGAQNPLKYDYYPTYNLGNTEKALFDSKWNAAGGNFIYRNSATDYNFNICFVVCDETGTADERGRNTVYQLGKQIYNKANAANNSSMRVLNPTDLRNFYFAPHFSGFTGSPDATRQSVDLKYLLNHPDDFFVDMMTFNVYAWNGSMYTNDSYISSIRPCIISDNFFIPVNNVLGRHIFGMTDYNSRRNYTQSFFGTYDTDNMPMSFVPLLTDETLTYDTTQSGGGAVTSHGNKWKWSYNYYSSTYELYAPARRVLELMAHCGCYMIDDEYSATGKTPSTMWNDEHIYLGEMLTGARTTGNFIKGTDLLTSDTINKGQYSTQTDFNPTPPGPGPGPYDDDPWSGVSFSGVGLGGGGAFARCYYMTSTELANLRSWMCGINVPEGFNPMTQIIGLSQVPVALSGDAPETVQFINSSAVYDPGVTSRVVDSGVSTQYSMGGPIKYSLGSVDITRRMQERGEPYLDYSCQIELYLPLIGVFSLDTQAVMGRTLEAEAILDPISGTLAAYAWVSKGGEKLPVAYGSTTISVDLPVTAQQYSVSKAALKQANAQLGTSLLSSVATLVAAAVGGGKAEGSNARVSGGASSMQGARGMNSYAQASSIAASQAAISQTGNVVGDFMQWGRTIKQLQYGNNTAISGSFGGSVAQWSYPFQAYVKINRPRYEKPDNYAHTQGVPCVQKKRIGDCTGFIQCIGVDVDNHIEGATDLERQAIQAALSSGIYAGGGGE